MEELKEQQAALEKQAVDKQRAMQEAQDKVRKAKEELATIEKAKQQASDKMDQAAQQVTPGPAVIVE